MQDRIPPLRYLFRSTHGTGGHCDRNPAEAMRGRPCGRKIERVRVAAHPTHPLVRLTRLVLDKVEPDDSRQRFAIATVCLVPGCRVGSG